VNLRALWFTAAPFLGIIQAICIFEKGILEEK
jgi:hypothetical protein